MIPLKEVIYNHNARGPWCALPYQGHPRGCPNLTKGCTTKRLDFILIRDNYHWYAVVEEFNLKSHAEYMKAKMWAEHKKNGQIASVATHFIGRVE